MRPAPAQPREHWVSEHLREQPPSQDLQASKRGRLSGGWGRKSLPLERREKREFKMCLLLTDLEVGSCQRHPETVGRKLGSQ